ncbi:transposase [Halapricum salinum]|uniref:Transposase n=2 Tax=Halapricum salinum TaxID=1457250 RepID=A0A4D6H765_9EURY|nr:transposase [Halapricum salinum]
MSSCEEYHRRTAVTRLAVSEPDATVLRQTVSEWKEGCQIAVDMAWDHCQSKSDLQRLAYDTIRDQTELGSQHAILACHQAADNIASCIAQRNAGQEVSKPNYTSPTVAYDSRTMTLYRDAEQVSLTTSGDRSRVRADLVLPPDEDGYQDQYLDSDEWELAESTLHHRGGEWYLHIGFRKLKPERQTTENGTVLGVDLGVSQIAVTSTAGFYSAGKLNHERREFDRLRRSLQAHGSRNAHRTLESVGEKEGEYVKHTLHRVAKELVEEALRYNCNGIVFEDLEGIRERLPAADWHSEWAFDRLFNYVEYKASFEGLFVDTVNPKNTSIRCAECGYIHESSRQSRSEFECGNCGNRNHADYNAAKNIAETYLWREQQSSRRRGVSQYALKSGTMRLNRGFIPYSEQSEVESMDKSRSNSESTRMSDHGRDS